MHDEFREHRIIERRHDDILADPCLDARIISEYAVIDAPRARTEIVLRILRIDADFDGMP